MQTWNQVTQEERIKRWEHVRKVLKKLTPHERRKHFDMGDWAIKTYCGTVACAAGHCGFDPWFRKRGFYFKFEKGDYEGDWILKSKKINGHGFISGVNNSVEIFFGLQGSENIFYQGGLDYPEVMRRIKSYIKELKEED